MVYLVQGHIKDICQAVDMVYYKSEIFCRTSHIYMNDLLIYAKKDSLTHGFASTLFSLVLYCSHIVGRFIQPNKNRSQDWFYTQPNM